MSAGARRKPLDVGNGRVTASFGTDGGWLSVGAAHPRLGMLELAGVPPFREADDGDGEAVRRHRARLADPAYACLRWEGDVAGVTEQWAPAGAARVVQRRRFSPGGAGRMSLRFSGRLDRPGYAEITPVGPRPSSLGGGSLRLRGSGLGIDATDGNTSAGMRIGVSCTGAETTGWVLGDDLATYEIRWPDGTAAVEVVVDVTAEYVAPPEGAARSRPGQPAGGDGVLERVSAGALRYVLGCTALDVGDDLCCIVTDHRLLPLSWTRDAYYQAVLLLSYPKVPAAADTVRRHLRWLWGPGRDRDGGWQRSHLTTGVVKDPAYQADQQLYPLLELADYRRVTGGWPDPPGGAGRSWWGEAVGAVWSALPRDASGLVPSEENPADDAAGLPYVLSNQLLLAHTARRLAEFADELGLSGQGLERDAAATLATVRERFECAGPGGPQFAYGSDGGSRQRLYHDANDVPTALAPLWGLCAPGDALWSATMRFAWSRQNPGYVPGRLGGLGSAHTPGTWTLGDAQEWLLARLGGDREREAAVLARLAEVAAADGMLPETYDAHTGAWLSRHWFAWPAALTGSLHRAIDHGAGPWAGVRGTRDGP